MTKKKQLKLGAFLSVPGNHLAGWRHPDAVPEYDMDFALYMRLAQTAERARGNAGALLSDCGISAR